MNELRKSTVPFTQIENRILRCPYLTFKAKGLYAYMMSFPDGWRFAMDRIAKETKESRDAIRTAFIELEQFHLVSRRKKSNGSMIYQFHDFGDSAISDEPEEVIRKPRKFL